MRILVTGGAGFIGSAVVRHCLRKTDHRILNFDCLTYAANLDNLKEVLPHERYAFAQKNVCDTAQVQSAFEMFDPDAVMHLAAESHVDRSIDSPSIFVQTNIVGTHVMLEAARRHFENLSPERRKDFRFHHISTDEVFGSLGRDGTFTETSPYAPNSPYAASKASSDMLVRASHHTYGLPVIISNCSNNYGPYQFPEKLIPVAILAALEGRAIPVYGKGLNVRDWLYVGDHAAALLAILEKGRPGESYNVGGRAELQNLELLHLLCETLDEFLNESRHRPHKKLIRVVEDRPGHDLRYAIDASKIERELGWRPSVTISQGIRDTVKWYLENRWWWRAIRERGHTGGRLGLSPTSSARQTDPVR